MIKTEMIGNRIRHYSDIGMKIRQIETDVLYEEAVDVLPLRYSYEETDIPIEQPDEEATTEDYEEALAELGGAMMKKSELLEKTAKVKAAQRTAATALDDATALEAKALYPTLDELVEAREKVNKGFRFQYGDKLYRTEQPEYTFDGQYKPDDIGVESLFSEVAKQGEGTRDNPIRYNNNMELVEGKYYEQNGVIYYCFRSTGTPVYNNLADLVNIYVELN